MISLIYVSAAIKELEADELQGLLKQARENNARIGVTGLLVYVSGNFLQILEGEEAQVHELYAHIARDPRHGHLIQLHEGPIGERQFGRWSMALANPAALGPDYEAESLAVIRTGLARPTAAQQVSKVHILLKSFADTMR